jgi:hypothetical protein
MKKVLFGVLVSVLALVLALPAGVAMADPDLPLPDYEPQYVIAAHAVVRLSEPYGEGTETAWADCNNSQDFPGGNWAFWFTYPGDDDEEGNQLNRWGLYAGQHTLMGYVYVDVDAASSTLSVRYLTWGDCELVETHVAVAAVPPGYTHPDDYEGLWELIPHNKGDNPKVGHFRAFEGDKTGETHAPGTSEYIYVFNIPIIP